MNRKDISIPGLNSKKQVDLVDAAMRTADRIKSGDLMNQVQQIYLRKAESLVKKGWTIDNLGWWHHSRNPGARISLSAALILQNRIDAHSHIGNIEEPEKPSPEGKNS